MKITPVILCGGAGTRLWPDSKKNIPKQFIDFGGWTLFEKTLQRIKNNIYSKPRIITNALYLKNVQKLLLKNKFLYNVLKIKGFFKQTCITEWSCSKKVFEKALFNLFPEWTDEDKKKFDPYTLFYKR